MGAITILKCKKSSMNSFINSITQVLVLGIISIHFSENYEVILLSLGSNFFRCDYHNKKKMV